MAIGAWTCSSRRDRVASGAVILDGIRDPEDLRELSDDELVELSGEIRDFIVAAVAETGGHLGSNLGVVELTLALHRVFDSPTDAILWDTGHQAYVHKLVTGRRSGFGELRQAGGLSGYPSPRGEPPRLRGERPRLDDPLVRLRAGRRTRRRSRSAPPHRRGDRRRLDDRRHGVRGTQQPRPQQAARHHRPQRQRPQLRPHGLEPDDADAWRAERADRPARPDQSRRRAVVAGAHRHPPQPDLRAPPASARGAPP